MSSNALFSNNGNRNVSKNLVEFKAGKMTMKGKMVYPDNRKGQLYVYQSDDSLMHFCWKDRSTGIVEDDLIIFPEDCEFKHVTQCKTGRVYLLKFKSSSRKFFFWLQDSKTDKDEEYCRKINEVLNNPPIPGSQRSSGANAEGDLQNLLNNMSQQQLMQLFGGVGQIGGLGSLLGTMNRPFSSGSRISTTSSITPVTTAKSTTSSTPNSTASTTTTTTTSIGSEIPKPTGSDKSSSAKSAECTTSIVSDNRIRLSDLQSFLSGIPKPSHIESEVQLQHSFCPTEGRSERTKLSHPSGHLHMRKPGGFNKYILAGRRQPFNHSFVSSVLPGTITILVCFAVGPGGPCSPAVWFGVRSC
ncbi:proteasomal ubiquitin receptor ADRM1 isoform X3 [Nasonia vitripennis]|uniref:Proteasomal ubiquitin receptor ADRM1 homolog n=1 Tax=Nasonia vitripennis TaxID=7425 RepID=A0A7M7T990_NASVI|nr:proteasomal ubiquitin receptor ADRM1 isoform X3 [Nasonia vitripennis]